MSANESTSPICHDSWRRLFDVEVIAAMLSEHPRAGEKLGAAPYEVRVERYWPQGAPKVRGIQVEWSVRARTGETSALFGQQRLDGKPQRARPPSEDTSRDPGHGNEPARGVFLRSADGRLLIHSPECDPILSQLATCLNAEDMGPRLSAFGFHGRGATAGLHCRLAGYRANRRAAIGYRFEPTQPLDPSLMGKTFRDSRGRELIQRHILVSEALRTVCGKRVRVPAPVGFDESLRLGVFFWMPGASLETVPHDGNRWMDAAVEAIGAIHELKLSGLPCFTAEDEARIVRRWGHALEQVAPELHTGVRTMIDRLLMRSGEIKTRHPRAIHRDFYDKQVVVDEGGVTVLDLDTLSLGDACVDLGNLLAHLYLKSLQHGESAGGFQSDAAAFLERYESRCGRVDRGTLGFFTASAFFRLGAVHSFRSHTQTFVPALWSAARALTEGGPLGWEQIGVPGKRSGQDCCVRGAA